MESKGLWTYGVRGTVCVSMSHVEAWSAPRRDMTWELCMSKTFFQRRSWNTIKKPHITRRQLHWWTGKAAWKSCLRDSSGSFQTWGIHGLLTTRFYKCWESISHGKIPARSLCLAIGTTRILVRIQPIGMNLLGCFAWRVAAHGRCGQRCRPLDNIHGMDGMAVVGELEGTRSDNKRCWSP
jgi:hypothetical protein